MGPLEHAEPAQTQRGGPLKLRGRHSFQAKRRAEALARQQDARGDLSDHIRRLACAALAGDAEEVPRARSLSEPAPEPSRSPAASGMDIDRAGRRLRGSDADAESTRAYYARQLMQPEWLIEAPPDLADEWYVLPRPEGQRCLVVAGEGRTVSRTRAGRLLHTFPSALPGGARGGADAAGGPCILDCVFHEPAGAYYVQDLMCWKGYALYDCSAEFRLFWLATKLGESGAGAPPGPRHRFPFVPVAAYACDPGGLHAALRGAVPFVRDGIALLHKEGHYALGPTPLALLWKDARCSRFHLDTDAAGAVPALQPVTLQCLPGGAVGTGDERPVALGRVPDAAAQQLGERLRPGRLLRFALAGGGLVMGPDGCPTSADLRYEGPANQRRAKADPLSKLLFQHRARMRPGLTLERLLEEEAGERGSDNVQQMHQDAPGACPGAPAEAMTLDVK